eukprot:TRINITY_DN3945_c0_g1_i2.p1 TRINITY_DN3945_c0_g1~~TRINITY_DN3945_c0_g1_i2.p1  ORF type:complete len:551 (-),score=202.83 TRINITY_DN3945_c0_g1_i2:80-1732(-)
MLATQMTSIISEGTVRAKSIVKLNEYQCNFVAKRRIAIVLVMELVSNDIEETIGNPTNIEQKQSQPDVKPQVNQSNSMDVEPKHDSGMDRKPEQKPSTSFSSTSSSSSFSSSGVDLSSQPVFAINMLNPYQNRWVIKARVTAKGDIRRWNNARGEGKLFSVELLDEQGGEIKATMFNEAVDKFYDLFKQESVYLISKGTLKPANRQYNTLNNDYELSLDGNSLIQEVQDDGKIEKVQFQFVTIDKLPEAAANSTVDVIGVIKSVGDSVSIQTKKGTTLSKRDVSLIDTTANVVSLTTWGNTADTFEGAEGQVLAVKGAKVSDFNGVSLSVWSSANLHLMPDCPETYTLSAWYESNGGNVQATSLTQARPAGGNTPRKTLSQIESENLGKGAKPDWFQVVATVTFIKKDSRVYYEACPSDNCNKKVVELSGHYRCEACDQSYESCDRRYILQLNAADATGNFWMNAFNDTGEKLLGINANELDIKKENDEAAYNGVFQAACFKQYVIKLRAKEEIYNDVSRVKCAIQSLDPIDYVAESKNLLDEIASLEAM